MKYFNALTEVEYEVIRLSELQNLLSVVRNGMESSTEEEIASSISLIEEHLKDININLSDKFQNLFDLVKEVK